MNSEAQVKDVTRFQQYVTEELNVRQVTVTCDKQAYGVSLRAEPDHKTLGARIKQAFKLVTAAIKVSSQFLLPVVFTLAGPLTYSHRFIDEISF